MALFLSAWPDWRTRVAYSAQRKLFSPQEVEIAGISLVDMEST